MPKLALRQTSMFSMGIDFADLNRDGLDEFLVLDMFSRNHAKRHLQVGDLPHNSSRVGEIDNRPQYSHNTLFVNRGDGTYAEIALFSGVQASDLSAIWVYLDLDLAG